MTTTARVSPPSPSAGPTRNRPGSKRRASGAWLLRRVVLPGVLLVFAPMVLGYVGVGAFHLARWAAANWMLIAAGIAVLFVLGSAGTMTLSGPTTYDRAGFGELAAALRQLLPSLKGGGGGGNPPSWVRWILAAVLTGLVLGASVYAGWRMNLVSWVMRHNLVVSILLVAAVLQFALHRSAREQLNWKKLVDPWLKFNGIGVIGVGGIGVLGATKTAAVIVDAVVSSPYLDLRALTTVYLAALALVGTATLIATVGRTRAEKEEEYRPLAWFAPAFALAWLGSVLVFGLFFDSLLLSIQANLSLPPTR